MNRRNWLCNARKIFLIAGVIVFPLWQPGFVLAQVEQKPEAAKSFSGELINLMSNGKPRPAYSSTISEEAKQLTLLPSKIVWSASAGYRFDAFTLELLSTTIIPAKGEGVSLQHNDKTYEKISNEQADHQRLDEFAASLKDFAEFDGSNRKPNAIEEIDGLKCARFDLKSKAIKDSKTSWDYRIWMHPDTKRPIRMDWKSDDATGDFARLSKIEWNVDTSKLLDITPPKGYRSKTWNVYDWTADQIAQSLGIYAQMFEEYPKVDRIDNKLMVAFEKKLKEKKCEPSGTLTGFTLLQNVLTDPTVKYKGKTVRLNDKDKILLSWVQPDGKIRVIFAGAMKSQAFTADEMKAIEK